MDLFIDNNVMLDHLGKREPFYQAARKICLLGIVKEADLYISVNMLTDLHYQLKKSYGSVIAQEMLEANLSAYLNVVGLSQQDAHTALSKRWDDFEECLVAESAASIKADYIITRNTKDFERSAVPAITPDQLFEKLELQGFDFELIDF